MEPFDELVNEVYTNISFRSEFTAMARLIAAIDLHEQQSPPAAASSPVGTVAGFMGYYEMREAFVYSTTLKMLTDPPAIKAYKNGITLLFSSLCKGLSAQYHLDINSARQLTFTVLDRYKIGA